MLSKKIDIGPDNWNHYIRLSTNNYAQTLHNLFDACEDPKQIKEVRLMLINDIEGIARTRLKEIINES